MIDDDEHEVKKIKPSDDLISPNDKKRKILAEPSTNQTNAESAEELNSRGEMCRDNPHGKVYSYREPFNLFKKAAEKGLPAAQINLAEMYENGHGVPKNEAKALELYKNATSQGYPKAQCKLAGIYQYGVLGVSQDISKAFDLYSKSANQGNARAQNNLGEMYEKGLGAPKDEVKALELYKKASAQGLPAAQRNLEILLESGLNTQKDEAKTEESPIKNINQLDITSTSPFPKESEKKDIACETNKKKDITAKIQYANPNIDYLTGSSDHSKYLLEGIKKSKKSIIITTYMLDINKKYHPKLCKQLESASLRKVDITIYFNHYPENERRYEQTQEALESIGNIKCYQIGNHAKGFIIDNNQFCMGSFNWLSDYNDINKNEESEDITENVSLILEGKLAEELAYKFCEYAKKYQSMTIHSSNRDTETRGGNLIGDQHTKFKDLFKTDERYRPIEEYIDSNNSLTLLTTPYQHHEFMNNAFNKSQIKIEIHSPFISKTPKELEERLPKEKIRLFTKKGKKLTICYSESEDSSLLTNYLHNYTHGIKKENVQLLSRVMHQKLFLIDNNTIAIGSFNWLSSPFKIADGINNEFNATLVLRGEIAVKAITHFRNEGIID